jgi:hypothetical protein
MNASRSTSGSWSWGRWMARSWINNTFVNFQFQCEVGNSVRTSKSTSFKSNAPFTKVAPQIPLITCCNLLMSDVCRVQCRHISCLVQSQCCQLILYIQGSYIYLQFRHNTPFLMDWLTDCPCLPTHTEQWGVPRHKATVTAAVTVATDTCRTAYTWNNICRYFCFFHKAKIVTSYMLKVQLHSILPWY